MDTPSGTDPKPVSSHDDSLTKGPLLPALVRFGGPLVLGMVAHALFNLIDLFLVSRIPGVGTEAIVAVSWVSILQMVPMVLGNGIATAIVALVATAYGEGKHSRCLQAISQSLLLLSLLSVVTGIVGVGWSRELCGFFGLQGVTLSLGHDYMWIMSAGAWTMFLILHTTSALRGAGEGTWPMLILVGANGLNLILDMILIFGWGPIPPLGVAGAAWATVIARGLGGVLGLALLIRGIRGIRLNPGLFRPERKLLWKILKISLPHSIQLLLRTAAYLVLIRIASSFENLYLESAFSIGIRLDMLAIFTAAGWGAAASTLVGQNLGANNPQRATQATWWIVLLSGVTMLLIGGSYLYWSEPLFAFFDPHPEVIGYGKTYMSYLSIAYLFIAISLVLSHALNGAGNTITPMFLDAVLYLPLQTTLALELTRSQEPQGIWIAILLSNLILALAYIASFLRGSWKHKKLWDH